MKNDFGMTPLTVTARPLLTLALGEKNLENFVRSGFDYAHVTPNQDAMRVLNKMGFLEKGFFTMVG